MSLSQSHWTSENFYQRIESKEWKQLLLNGGDKIIFKGCVRILKAKSLGYGVVEVSKISQEESDKILFRK
jgi:hypothetical protein